MTRSGYTCIRRVFCWLNISLWLTGCGVLAVALWLKFAYEGYISLLPQYALLSADSILLIVGGLTLVLAFFGCCGSWFQNRCLLITENTTPENASRKYLHLKSRILDSAYKQAQEDANLEIKTEIFLGALAFIFRRYLGNTILTELRVGIQDHYNTTMHGPNSLVSIWDHVQTDLRCCGIVNSADWFNIDAWPTETWVPDSCCVAYEENCGRTGATELWYSRGCADQIHMWFIERLYIIGIMGLVVAFIQLFGLISSMLLFCTVKKRRLSQTYTSFSPNA